MYLINNSAGNRRTFTSMPFNPVPGSDEEKEIFETLQREFVYQYDSVFPDKLASKTVVIIPSLTLDMEILSTIKGHVHYEERMLCMLMLLRMPQTHVIFVSSIPIDDIIVDYYLHLLPGITGHHARQRLAMFSCYDASARPLTQKILERPRLINRIRQAIGGRQFAHLVFFNVAEPERTLAVQLGLPLYGCNPSLLHLGSKSGSRNLFKKCKVSMPDGFENLSNKKEIVDALYQLKIKHPGLNKAVIKLNEGFSGEGNAVFNYQNVMPGPSLKQNITKSLRYVHVIAERMNYVDFLYKFEEFGGVVEVFIDSELKKSPSVQCRINPRGEVTVISTHDQVLSGEDNQVFIGAHFPASAEYAAEITSLSVIISEEMARLGVLGRFSIDFLSVKDNNVWKHYAIEINLRKGGTTHPYLMLQFLTDGSYDAGNGLFKIPLGQPRYYFASDNVWSPAYVGLLPADLIDIAMYHGIMYDATTQQGVMFHLIGALSQFGKLGMVCIATSPQKAKMLFDKTIEILNQECGQTN